MAVRTKAAAPVMGRDYFAVIVDLRDDSLEIKDRETGEPKEVEITRFSFCVDTETAGYYDLEGVAWGDTGRSPSWSDRSFAGRIYKAAMRQEIPASFDDQTLLFRPFYVTLKEQLKDGTAYFRIDEVKAIPDQIMQGQFYEAIRGQIDELLQAARSGKKVIPDSPENKANGVEQQAAEQGIDLPEAEDIPF